MLSTIPIANTITQQACRTAITGAAYGACAGGVFATKIMITSGTFSFIDNRQAVDEVNSMTIYCITMAIGTAVGACAGAVYGIAKGVWQLR